MDDRRGIGLRSPDLYEGQSPSTQKSGRPTQEPDRFKNRQEAWKEHQNPCAFLPGSLSMADIQRIPLAERGQSWVEEAMQRDVLVVYPDDTLDEALEELTSRRVSWAPVVDAEALSGDRHVMGTVSAASIVRLYRQTLAKDSGRMRGLIEGTVMLETTIQSEMRLANVPLRDAQLPAECLVVSIRREDELLFPRGSTVIRPGDVVTFLVNQRGEARLQRYLHESRAVESQEAVALD
jgi:CIC family chloride channel protein